jgi:hypothetical protein
MDILGKQVARMAMPQRPGGRFPLRFESDLIVART